MDIDLLLWSLIRTSGTLSQFYPSYLQGMESNEDARNHEPVDNHGDPNVEGKLDHPPV